MSDQQSCTCGCHDKTRELRARVRDLEAGEQEARLAVMRMKDDDRRIRDLEAVIEADDLASHVIEYRARISELEAELATLSRENYDLLEREKHTQATYEETGKKIIDQHNQIQELLGLVRLLKKDAADGTSRQHFRDGAEAALQWVIDHPPVTLSGYREPGDHYIQRALRAVAGEEEG